MAPPGDLFSTKGSEKCRSGDDNIRQQPNSSPPNVLMRKMYLREVRCSKFASPQMLTVLCLFYHMTPLKISEQGHI